MKSTRTNRASALIVAVGLLAVLSAMAFTFVTIMRVEMDATISMETMTQTQLLDEWAVQKVVERLKRTECEGAMYTPVDWAGEEWYCRPLIEDSPAFPLGTVMAFGEDFAGKGTYTIEARLIDCSSQINLSCITDKDSIARTARMLACIPFRMDHAWKSNGKLERVGTPDEQQVTLGVKYPGDLYGILSQDELEHIVAKIAKLKQQGNLTSKEGILNIFLEQEKLKARLPRSIYSTEQMRQEKIAELFMGKRDMGGNILTVGWKDFITLDSWVDENTVDRNFDRQPRAPININTAPVWTLIGVFNDIRSAEGAVISYDDARRLAESIVAYRTPKSFLPDDLQDRQDELREGMAEIVDDRFGPSESDIDNENEDYRSDPRTEKQVELQLNRMAHLLVNPSAETYEKQWEEIDRDTPDDEDISYDDELSRDKYNNSRLPRPFATWAQFDAFLKYLVVEGKTFDGSFELQRKKARAVMANCNPNSTYSRQPVRNLCTMWNCGKDQVIRGTTELCFGTFGRYEVELVVGKARVLQSGTLGGLNGGSFGGTDNRNFRADLDVSKIRTIAGSAFAPDRLYLSSRDDDNKWQVIATRAFLQTDADTGVMVLDRPVSDTVIEALIKGDRPTRWEIKRLESVKKWNSILKFADVVRFDTVADFWRSSRSTGSGKNALYFPQPARKKQGAAGSSDLMRDGAISMLTTELERDHLGELVDKSVHLYETFPNGLPQEGLLENNTGSIYSGSRLFASGMWLRAHANGKLPIKFNFIDTPRRKGFFPNVKGTANKEITVSMWICLNDRGVSGTILDCSGKDFNGSPVRLSIVGNKLKVDFKGQGNPKTGFGNASLSVSDISIADWRPGEWHWIGFSFKETHQTGGNGVEGAEAQLFASSVKENYGPGDDYKSNKLIFEMDLDVEKEALPEGSSLSLYSSSMALKDARVTMGPIDAVVDDITVRWDYYGNEAAIKGIMPRTRYQHIDESGLTADNKLRTVKYESPKFSIGLPKDVEIEYGTIAWTEHMTWRSLRPKTPKDSEKTVLGKHYDFSNAVVQLWRAENVGSEEPVGWMVGAIDFEAEKNYRESQGLGDVSYDSLIEIPVWVTHEERKARWGPFSRIGRRGEGQRIGAPVAATSGKPDNDHVRNENFYWTGEIKDNHYYTNVFGSGDDVLSLHIELFGPADDPLKDYNDPNDIPPDVESPYIDDVTITFFTPVEVLYWRASTDVVE